MEPDDDKRDIQPGGPQFYAICPPDIEQLRIVGPPGKKVYYVRVFQSFQYPRITDPDCIRLLHLHPCKNDPSYLYGDLRVHKLDAHCEYEAISYSWGDYPKFTKGIFLNGQILRITENLYAALLAYSLTNRPRVLWVDAICINQEDTAEKSQQVAIMADIYSKAKTVQVWLSPHSPSMTEAIRFIENLSSKATSFGANDEILQHPRDHLPSIDISRDRAKVLINDAIHAHVDVFFLCSWFNRVWIVQEATLATELVLSCGLSTIRWDVFAVGAKILRGALRKLPDTTERQRMKGIKPTWALIWYRQHFRLLDQYCKRSHHIMTTDVARLMSNRACSDDRDRVYSMLALTTSPYTMLPDYNNTVAEVYTIFTRKYSPNSQLFGAGLCRRQNQPRPEQETNSAESRQPIDIGDRNYLPSWVPELRPSLNLAWASPFAGRYSTAKAAPYFFRPHPEILNIMHVTGTIFDVIYKATWEYPDKGNAPHLAVEPGFYFSIIDNIQNLQLSPLDSSAELNPVSEPSWLILAKALTAGVSEFEHAEYILSQYPHFQGLAALGPGSLPWLTAIWNQFEAHCLSPTGEVFQQILLETLGGKPKPLSTDGKIALGFLVYIANILDTNRLFMTCGRYLGLAPKGTRIGDFIAVINGLDTPYVVRSAGKVKYKDPKGGGQETENDLDKPRPVQVIGPCYLHGIMNGEIFANRDAPQFSHLGWTRYDGDKVDSLEGGLALI